jgi:hypothetical protein
MFQGPVGFVALYTYVVHRLEPRKFQFVTVSDKKRLVQVEFPSLDTDAGVYQVALLFRIGKSRFQILLWRPVILIEVLSGFSSVSCGKTPDNTSN